MAELTPREEARRSRVVHGWAFGKDADDPAFVKHVRQYLKGKRSDPPRRYAQIDKAMG